MIDVEVFGISVPLKTKFVVSQGEATIKTNLLTVMNNRYNGEAAGSVYYGPDVETLRVDIEKGLEQLRAQDTIDESTLDLIDQMDLLSAARSALMGMTVNYLSGEQRRYPWEVLTLGSPVGIRSSWTVAIDKPADMLTAIKESRYPIVKVKMGNEEDVLLLDGLAKVSDKEIRVDANGGWSCAKAEEMIHHLAKCGVTVIEQPTAIDFVKEWPHLKSGTENVELFVDEGNGTVDDFEQIGEFVDGVNIKPEKSGGILPASRLASSARREGKKVMLGCMVASSVGIAQSIYMSSLADYFDLDGPLLLKDDVGRGVRYDRETIKVDREIIGGPKLKRDILEKYMQK